MSVNIGIKKKIEDIPFLLLTKICRYLDDDVDRICLSLACKRWFQFKNKWLFFNCRSLSLIKGTAYLNANKYFTLNSFRQEFTDSLERKSNGKMLIPSESGSYSFVDDRKRQLFDDEVLMSKVKELKGFEILPHFTKLVLDVDGHIESEFIDTIANSNIESIAFTKLPRIKNDSVLPPNIKKVKSLFFIEDSQLHKLLPRGLSILKIKKALVSPFDISVLPPNLKELVMYSKGFKNGPETSQFPSSLESLSILTSSLPYIKDLKSLYKLVLCPAEGVSLKPGDIPLSVTHLTISNMYYYSSKTISSDIIPPNVTFLKFENKIGFKKNTFKSFAKLETLDLSAMITDNDPNFEIGELPVSLVNLSMPKDFTKRLNLCLNLKALKNLETLDFGEQYKSIVSGIPNTVKTLKLNQYSKLTQTSIPSSVETIDFRGNCRLIVPEDWPKSVKTIIIQEGIPLMFPTTLKSIKLKIKNHNFQIRRLSDNSFLIVGGAQNDFRASIIRTSELADATKNYFPKLRKK